METDPRKSKQLQGFQKLLDVLLAKEGSAITNTAKRLPVVSFGNAAQKAAVTKVVNMHSGLAAGIGAAMAQLPGGDEVALFANDMAMARGICKAYDLTPKAEVLTGIITGMIANKIGISIFTKALTVIPGPGNAIGAGVAAAVTKFVGHGFIKLCEEGGKGLK